MIVCSCNQMTDKEIRTVLEGPHPPTCVRDVYGALGCSPVCGGCAGTIKKLLDARQGCGRALDPVARVEENEPA